jgi:PAS domain S-box-containing protein
MTDIWETAQGLPNDSVTSVVQSDDGALWLGTFRGLVRFDGTHFKVFDRSNTPDLPSPAIVTMHLDRQRRLWVSTPEGTAFLKDGRWTVYRPGEGWVGNQARYFVESEGNALYASTFAGILLQYRGNGFEQLPPPPCNPSNGIFPQVDQQGVLWAASSTFIGKLVNNKWEEVVVPWKKESWGGVGASRDGGLWVVTRERIRKLLGGKIVLDADGPYAGFGVWSVSEDSTGSVWFSTFQDGIYRFVPPASPADVVASLPRSNRPREVPPTRVGPGQPVHEPAVPPSATGSWRHYSPDNGLSYNSVRCVFEDHEKNLWMGTDGGGLQRFRRRTFRSWMLAKSLSGGNRFISVCADRQGHIYAGTHAQGVVAVDGDELRPLVFPDNVRLPSKTVQSILCDRLDRLWIGTLRGLHMFNGSRLQSFTPDQVPALTITALFEDSKGRIWIGSDEGITCYDGNKFTKYQLDKKFERPTIACFAEDRQSGTIWAGGTMPGLVRLEGNCFRRVPSVDLSSENEISALLADADGTLWIGTNVRGLLCLHHEKLFAISEAQGLRGTSIGAITDDGRGSLWLSSERGILRVSRLAIENVMNGKTLELPCQVFDRNDGLPAAECDIGNQPSAVKDTQGRLWFVTARGLARTNPRAPAFNTEPARLSLQKVLIDGQLAFANDFLSLASPPKNCSVVVPPGSKRIEIHYQGLSLGAPEKVRYRYMIEGVDKAWVNVGDQNVAYLADPKPGQFRFLVSAANEHGVWSQSDVALDLDIQANFWQTLWFKTVAFAAIVVAAVAAGLRITRLRLHRQFDRLKQQRALQREQARLASVLEATSDLVAFAELDGRLLYLNGAGRALLGMRATGELRPCKLTDVLPTWAAQRVLKEGIPAAVRDGIWRGETSLLRADGRELPLSQVLAVHRAHDGSAEFLSTIARDISDQKRLESQFAHSQRIEAIGRLAGGVAHDFNNILTAILGYSDVVLQRLHQADPMRDEIEEINRAAERAAGLTRQLLAFSRKQTLQPTVLDLNEVVTGTDRLLRRLIGEDIQLVAQLEPDLHWIKADRGQLEQVIMNLALNARDAMPHGGCLTIATANTQPKRSPAEARARSLSDTCNSDIGIGPYVLMSIRDTGCGMDEATLARLFEPYFTTKELGKGTGLGLATVYGIIRQSGGHVQVSSTVGNGTTFRIWLPATEEEPASLTNTPREAAFPQAGETVLVVEDEDIVRMLTCRLLTDGGYRVLEAGSAEEAMQVSRKHAGPIHLLLTDVIMPGQPGPELARRLAVERPRTHVLYMSGYPSRPGSDLEELNGESKILTKPFTHDALMKAVREALGTGIITNSERTERHIQVTARFVAPR